MSENITTVEFGNLSFKLVKQFIFNFFFFLENENKLLRRRKQHQGKKNMTKVKKLKIGYFESYVEDQCS